MDHFGFLKSKGNKRPARLADVVSRELDDSAVRYSTRIITTRRPPLPQDELFSANEGLDMDNQAESKLCKQFV